MPMSTALPVLFSGAMAVWCLVWPSGEWAQVSIILGGINAFLAGLLLGQWHAYRHVDQTLKRFGE